MADLTAREAQVRDLVKRGKTTGEIADSLDRSSSQISSIKRRLVEKGEIDSSTLGRRGGGGRRGRSSPSNSRFSVESAVQNFRRELERGLAALDEREQALRQELDQLNAERKEIAEELKRIGGS
jgi:DNA-directed RNA polymerase specialized sigma subunit